MSIARGSRREKRTSTIWICPFPLLLPRTSPTQIALWKSESELAKWSLTATCNPVADRTSWLTSQACHADAFPESRACQVYKPSALSHLTALAMHKVLDGELAHEPCEHYSPRNHAKNQDTEDWNNAFDKLVANSVQSVRTVDVQTVGFLPINNSTGNAQSSICGSSWGRPKCAMCCFLATQTQSHEHCRRFESWKTHINHVNVVHLFNCWKRKASPEQRVATWSLNVN